MLIKALIFDMDGTLGDTLPTILIAMRETLARFAGQIYTDNEIVEMFGPSDAGIIMRRVPPASYEPALQYYLKRYAELHTDQPFPGIRELMGQLQERGIRMGVATGKGPEAAAISMYAYGIEQYIDRMETGSVHGAVKPELIRRLLDHWRVPAGQVGYVGDAQSDMLDARAAGVLPLGAAWSQTSTISKSDTPYRFTSVEALKTWLASM